MTYSETLDWLFSQLPMYQRTGGANYKIDLEKTWSLMKLLGHPERKLKAIHVAGTNGKGSTSHMIASTLQESGYKTGLYTSPHLIDFRERVKVDGQVISEEYVVNFVQRNKSVFEDLALSFFEMTVGLAFDYFVSQNTDIVVIEVGMGGRLDSTNVLEPLVSVITNIGLDHQQFLGNTIAEICKEKAGIIKKETPVVIGAFQNETAPIFQDIAAKLNAPLVNAYEREKHGYTTDLKGLYQQQNLNTAVATLGVLKNLGWNLPEAHIKNGLRHVVPNTGLLGRWQIVQQNPQVICDTGHNIEGISEVVHQLSITPCRKLHMVWGMINDKDPQKYLNLLPKDVDYYFCAPSIPRKMPVETLAQNARDVGLKGNVYPSVREAYDSALRQAEPEDLVFVGGSTFVVADFLESLD